MTHSLNTVFVDSHIHLYDLFDLELFLDHALQNFQDAARQLTDQGAGTYVLFLTQSAKDKGIHRVRSECEENAAQKRWKFDRTEEADSFRAVSPGKGKIFLLPGLQINTAEKLEVLALGTAQAIPDGLSAEATLASIRESGAIPVLPWGVGKWLGRRGALVTALIEKATFPHLFLGDNSGRPGFWGTPRHFSRNPGLKVLPGSDPLPLPSEVGMAARNGFHLHWELDEKRPTESLLTAIRDARSELKPFGKRERLLSFLRNQFAIQWQNRRSLSGAGKLSQ